MQTETEIAAWASKLENLESGMLEELQEQFELQRKPAAAGPGDPVGDPGPSYVFDRHLEPITQTAPSVNSAEASPA